MFAAPHFAIAIAHHTRYSFDVYRFRSIAIALLVSMAFVNSLHLPVLQVGAWAGMILSYSRDASLAEAVSMTFDEEHPCPMCTAIKKQQTSERGELAPATSLVRMILFLESPAAALMRPLAWRAIDVPAFSGAAFLPEPVAPPPRLVG